MTVLVVIFIASLLMQNARCSTDQAMILADRSDSEASITSSPFTHTSDTELLQTGPTEECPTRSPAPANATHTAVLSPEATTSTGRSRDCVPHTEGHEPRRAPVVRSMDYAGYVFVPVLCILGLLGNVLTIRVMTSRSFRHLSVSVVLVALALSDTAVNLLFPFNKPFVRHLLGADVRALSDGGCKLFFWAYRYFKTTSSWMVVLISGERFVAVWLHLRAKRITTRRNMMALIWLVYALLAVFIGYWCSFADRILNGSCIPNTKPPGLERRAEAFLIVGLSLYAFIPSGVLVLLNALIVVKLLKLRMAKITKISGVGGGKPDSGEVHMKSTGMLIGIAVAFVVLVTPVSCAHLYSFTAGVNIFQTTEPGMVFFREVSQVMEQMNNSINFILYIVCSRRFRVQLMKTLHLKRITGIEADITESVTKDNNGPTQAGDD